MLSILVLSLCHHNIKKTSNNLNIELQFLAKVFRFHMKSAGFHEIRMKSGGFQVKSTPNLIKSDVSAKTLLIGLLKNERPILDHHAKAHNFEIQWIS